MYTVLGVSVCTQFCVRLWWFVPGSVYDSVGLYPVLCMTLLVCTQLCVRLCWFVHSYVVSVGLTSPFVWTWLYVSGGSTYPFSRTDIMLLLRNLAGFNDA